MEFRATDIMIVSAGTKLKLVLDPCLYQICWRYSF